MRNRRDGRDSDDGDKGGDDGDDNGRSCPRPSRHFVYEGLITSHYWNATPRLECTGLGDRLLRWQIAIALAASHNASLLIPVCHEQRRRGHELNATQISLFAKGILLPCSVSLVTTATPARVLATAVRAQLERVHLVENRVSGALVNPWSAVPRQWRLSREAFLNALQHAQIKPRSLVAQDRTHEHEVYSKALLEGSRTIAVHIRMGDLHQGRGIVDNIIDVVAANITAMFRSQTRLAGRQLQFRLLTDDSCEQKRRWEDRLEAASLKIANSTCNAPDGATGILADYEALWQSHAIVSICKRGYSAFPFAVTAQTGTPLLFLGETSTGGGGVIAQQFRRAGPEKPSYWGVRRYSPIVSTVAELIGRMFEFEGGPSQKILSLMNVSADSLR